jgi:class 3 adenylate cyclase
MPGTEIHANILATLIDRAFITTPWLLSTALLLIVMGMILGAVLARLSLFWGALATIVHQLLWRAVSLVAFVYAAWRVEVISMLALGVLVYGVTFALRWRWMRRMLGMVKSEAIARTLEADPSQLGVIGEEREVTILFSDIRNFTPFCETHTAREVVELLNQYFTAVIPRIESDGGTIAQYNGDGVMVIYGAPQAQRDHPLRAVRSATAMIRRVHELEDRWKMLGAEDFRIGVGVHTGRAVVGAVGSPRRLDYTAHGDTVNTASRIESANKELGTEILISEAVFRALPETERQRFCCEQPPRELSVKGRKEAINVYCILAEPPEE